MQTKKIKIVSTALIIFISLLVLNTDNAFSAKNDARTDIAVKDYTWLSSGTGRAAILKDITLVNKSSKDYKNIEVKIDLYSKAGIPLGTLRANINKILPSNSEQTYTNIKMGIMSTNLEDSTAKIVRAELSGRARFEDPRNLIVIKDWKFKGGNYSTEGFIDEITIENKSDKHFKNIDLKVSDLGTKGQKVGQEGYVTKVTIHKILPAKTTRTFKNINVGFSHPDVTDRLISVSDATIITKKELRYLLTKDDKEKAEIAKDLKTSNITIDEQDYEEIDRRLTLSQRYQKKIAEEKGEEYEPQVAQREEIDTEVNVETIDPDYKKEIAKQEKLNSKDSKEVAKTTGKKKINTIEEYEKYLGGTGEEPFPKTDIQIRKFQWGSGVPGTLGIIKKLVLENTSNIPYTKIELELTFLTPSGISLSSNKFKVYDVLPPNSTKEYKNVKVGIINTLPNQRDMRLEILDAQNL